MLHLIVHRVPLALLTSFCFFSSINSTINGQNKELTGVVIDGISKKLIPFTSIAIYQNTDLIRSGSADSSGYFSLSLTKEITHLQFNFLGYKSSLLLIDEIKKQYPVIIALEPDNHRLDEIVISSNMPDYYYQPGMKIIRLNKDVHQNMLDAFEEIPEIQTDQSAGTISIRGNDNVNILLNGHATSVPVMELLQQISSSQVDRIEIITNPSAKYQAEGLSGLINIVLLENRIHGNNLSMNTSYGVGKSSFIVSGSHHTETVNLRLNASRSGTHTTDYQYIARQFSNGLRENINTSYQLKGVNYKIMFGADFFFLKNQEFSANVDYTFDPHRYLNFSQFFQITGRPDYSYLRDMKHIHQIPIYNLNYRIKFKKEAHFLECDYYLNNSHHQYSLMDKEDDLIVYQQLLDEKIHLQNIALDYSIPLSKSLNFEAGVINSEQTIESRNTSFIHSQPGVKTDFLYKESIWGLYGIGKIIFAKFNLQVGMRFENFYTHSNGDQTIPSQYEVANLFPSIQVSYSLKEHTELRFGYSRRVSRPDFHQVNALQIVSPLFTWEYNPHLVPEYSRNMELSLHHITNHFTLVLTGFFRNRKDPIIWVESSNKEEEQVFHYENSDPINTLGIENSIQSTVTNFWTSTITTNFAYSSLQNSTMVTWHDNYSGRFQFKNMFQIGKWLSTDIQYIYTPKNQSIFHYDQPRNRFDGNITGRLFDNKLAVNLKVVDIFNQNMLQKTSQTTHLRQQTKWDIHAQTLHFLLSVSYRFLQGDGNERNKKERRYSEIPID